MKIITIEKYEIFEIKTDTNEQFRRTGNCCWEKLYGESWESEYSKEYELEEEFQQYLKEHKL
jgi:hypothetical protein